VNRLAVAGWLVFIALMTWFVIAVAPRQLH
jgi:hypothetical protein